MKLTRNTRLRQKKYINLDVTALGNSVGTGSKGITANVIEVKSFDELETKKDTGKRKDRFL